MKRQASINLTEPFEIVGEWFLPDAPERVASGRLLYEPAEGLTLEAISDLPLLFGRDQVPIVLGLSVDGRRVTLRNIIGRQERVSTPGGALLRASVDYAFVGMHAASEDDLRFHSLEARLSHLNDWCCKKGFDLEKTVWPRAGTIGFGSPSPIALAKAQGALFAIRFEFKGEPDRVGELGFTITLEQQAWLLIRPRSRWHYDDFDRLLTQARWFFSFAARAQDELLALRGEATIVSRTFGPSGRTYRTKEHVWILFGRQKLQSPEKRTAAEMLFCLPDAEPNITRPLTRWLNLCRRLEMEPVFGPYFAALARDRMYLDVRFILLATAADGYHARRHPASRNHPASFKTRIESLIGTMPRPLRQLVPRTVATEVKDTRNHASHRDARSWKRAARGARLYAITELLKLAFDVAILRELGFSQGEIAHLVERNRWLAGTMRGALDLLASTTPGRTRP